MKQVRRVVQYRVVLVHTPVLYMSLPWTLQLWTFSTDLSIVDFLSRTFLLWTHLYCGLTFTVNLSTVDLSTVNLSIVNLLPRIFLLRTFLLWTFLLWTFYHGPFYCGTFYCGPYYCRPFYCGPSHCKPSTMDLSTVDFPLRTFLLWTFYHGPVWIQTQHLLAESFGRCGLRLSISLLSQLAVVDLGSASPCWVKGCLYFVGSLLAHHESKRLYWLIMRASREIIDS